jgi:hypothetical protein
MESFMKFLVLCLSIFSTSAHAATFSGVVGHRQAPGSIRVERQGNLVRVAAQDTSCIMKFGPILGIHKVIGGSGHVYKTGYQLAIGETCGERVGSAVLYIEPNGRPLLVKKYGKIGGYLFR